MKRVVVVGVLILVAFLGIILAEDNNSNNSSNNETNNTNLTLTCFDSDGGKDYEEKGKSWAGTNCTGDDCLNITAEEVYDSCLTDKILKEGYCEEGERFFTNYTCPGVCDDGRCKANETDDNETEDNETEIKVCCKITRTEDNETDVKYNRIEQNDCVSSNATQITREVVADSFCTNQSGREASRERQRIKFEARTGVECPIDCRCQGVTMKCPLESGGREMTIFAGSSGNIIIQVKGVNATTNVTLYRDGNGSIYGVFTGGREVRIKFMPDEIRIKLKDKIKAKLENEEIELNEDGNYKVKVMKKARLFWVIPVDENVDAEINAETGTFVKLKGRWWGWMANDIDED